MSMYNNRFVKFLNTWPGTIVGGLIFAAMAIVSGVISGDITINWP